MSERGPFAVFLVRSTGHAIRAEQVLHMAGITCKLIPVPRHISSDCGVCVRVTQADVSAVEAVLRKNKAEFESVHNL